jgi:hypothetical protein
VSAVGCIEEDVICDDNNKCTIDSCNATTGACTYTPINTDDGNPCMFRPWTPPARGERLSCDMPAYSCAGTEGTCDPDNGVYQQPKTCQSNDACMSCLNVTHGKQVRFSHRGVSVKRPTPNFGPYIGCSLFSTFSCRIRRLHSLLRPYPRHRRLRDKAKRLRQLPMQGWYEILTS